MTTPTENSQWRLWVDIIDQECRRQFNTRRPKRHHPRPYIQTWTFPYHGFHITVYASHIQLDGDTHHTPEDTPIYNQLKEQE